MQRRLTVSQILRELNAPRAIERAQSSYTSALAIGGGTDWAGANLNAAWYLRNAKIHAKFMKLAKPSDRIVVLYGADHNYWLRDLVRANPGFVLMEARTYLRYTVLRKTASRVVPMHPTCRPSKTRVPLRQPLAPAPLPASFGPHL